MINNEFSQECLDLYKGLVSYNNVDRDTFFSICISERLSNLIDVNGQQIDDMLQQLDKFVDGLLFDKQPYERCSNYKEKNKTLIKHNINFVARVFKKYNKSCISSAKLLSKLIREGGLNA